MSSKVKRLDSNLSLALSGWVMRVILIRSWCNAVSLSIYQLRRPIMCSYVARPFSRQQTERVSDREDIIGTSCTAKHSDTVLN